MARPLRIEFADALHDVTSRCNDRRSIVRDDADQQRQCEGPVCRRFGYGTREIAEALGYLYRGRGTVTTIRRVEATGDTLCCTPRKTGGLFRKRLTAL